MFDSSVSGTPPSDLGGPPMGGVKRYGRFRLRALNRERIVDGGGSTVHHHRRLEKYGGRQTP